MTAPRVTAALLFLILAGAAMVLYHEAHARTLWNAEKAREIAFEQQIKNVSVEAAEEVYSERGDFDKIDEEKKKVEEHMRNFRRDLDAADNPYAWFQ